MTSAALDRALTEPADPPLRPLPQAVDLLLRRLAVPPRLAAHLRAVHDVACELLTLLCRRYPQLTLDADAVRYGAAVHDIGKAVRTDELTGPGSEHERIGYRLLLEQHVPDRLARFARTHADWAGSDIDLEDLLVGLADKIWKAKRVPELEQLVVDRIATAAGQEPWQVFMALDDMLTELARDADRRLAFQSRHATS